MKRAFKRDARILNVRMMVHERCRNPDAGIRDGDLHDGEWISIPLIHTLRCHKAR